MVTKTRRARLQAVSVGGDFVEFVEGEVLGLGPGGELLQAEIDRVGPEVKRRERRLEAAGGGEQLDGSGAALRFEQRYHQRRFGCQWVIFALRLLRFRGVDGTPIVPGGDGMRVGGSEANQRQGELCGHHVDYTVFRPEGLILAAQAYRPENS